MRPDDIDRALADEEDILPSSGFVVSVIEALRREVLAPAPIPFPWRRAWLGVVAAVLALVVVPAVLFGPSGRAAAARSGSPTAMPSLTALYRPAAELDAQWLVLAIVLTLAAIVFAKRVTGGRV